MSRSDRGAAIGVVLALQPVGLGILLVGLATRWGFCLEADSSTCSDASPVAGAVIVTIAVAVLLGAFAVGARVAKLPAAVRTGLAHGLVAWAGGVLVAAATGARPLVGVVFGVGTAMVMVAPERHRPAAAVAAGTGLVAFLEVFARNDWNGLMALVALAAVTVMVLTPAD